MPSCSFMCLGVENLPEKGTFSLGLAEGLGSISTAL